MKLLNCKLEEVKFKLKDKKIVFFGAGSWIKSIDYSELMALKEQFAYVVDNNTSGKISLGDMLLDVLFPSVLQSEENVVVILTSPVYMYDMYLQLVDMKLDCECYAFPFMQMISENKIDPKLLNTAKNQNCDPKIPKMIHSFWFSGEQKPKLYQKCINSWKEKLQDYKICEWNMDNYDWRKHPFMKKAIEQKAWAFASDYARLDVLDQYGGIYLDMDVEVFKNFDDLLCNDGMLSYSNHVLVDLAVMGAKKNNRIIQSMLKLYDHVELPNNTKGFVKFFQPTFVRKTLVENGVSMDGSLQILDDATVFPNTFFMPQDQVLFRPYDITENTYCVHYDNFGWSFSKDNKREKKIKDNNKLWNEIEDI